jgi:hypothetical protein
MIDVEQNTSRTSATPMAASMCKLQTFVFMLLFVVAVSSRLAAQPIHEERSPTTPSIGAPAIHPPAAPTETDTKYYLRVSATYDGESVKEISISRGTGLTLSYLSERSDVVVLLKSGTKVLKRINLPDPLEIRVWDTPGTTLRTRAAAPFFPSTAAASAPRYRTHSISREKIANLTIFLPQLDGADTIEFRSSSEEGKLLGRSNIPDFH